ncbi:hypothetical protein Pfo_027659 [Paulownia fortunei]|nr:hypothetical protein Pfo_027659 [Paulownia fortunei]
MDHCLAVRQQLKEAFRARLRKETGSAVATGKENAAPADNYGRFFGTSEIVFSDRVIQETQTWSENPKSAVKELERKLKNDGDKKKTAAGSMAAKTIMNAMNRRRKVQWLKDTRDYSFLSSDCEIPVPGNKDKNSRPPEMMKEKGSKIQGLKVIKRDSETRMKNSRAKKEQASRNSKKPLEPRRKIMHSSKEKLTVPKPQSNKSSHQKNPCLVADGRKRKLEQRAAEEKEEINAISIIRRMFGYNPTRFCDDEEDVNMESTFADIQKEERRSTKMARKEEDEELRKKVGNTKKLKQMN